MNIQSLAVTKKAHEIHWAHKNAGLQTHSPTPPTFYFANLLHSHLENTIPKHDAVDGRNFANQLRSVVYPIIFRILYIPGGCLAFLCISSINITLYKDFTSLFFWTVPVFDGARKTMVGCSIFCQIFPQWWHKPVCACMVQKRRSGNSCKKPGLFWFCITCESPPIHLARCSTPFCWAENFTGPTLPRATYLYHELCRTLRKTPQADLQAPNLSWKLSWSVEFECLFVDYYMLCRWMYVQTIFKSPCEDIFHIFRCKFISWIYVFKSIIKFV